MSLWQKVFRGLKWTSGAQLVRQGAQFISTLVLARLLSPSDFGLMSMAAVVTGLAALFKDMGTASAIIQRKQISEELLSSVLWVNVVIGVFTMVSIIMISELIATFYKEPRIVPILRLLSISFVISSLGNVHQALLEKQMKFRNIAIAEIIAALLGALIGILSAFKGYGVWSLVFQSIGVTLATTLMFWLINPWIPRWSFRLKEIRSVIGYSLNLAGFNMLNYVTRNADNILIGRVWGAQELGYYNIAYRIMYYPIQSLSFVMSRVLFPLFSQHQDDNRSIKDVYMQITTFIANVTFPLMMGMAVLSKPFVHVVFGVQWVPASPIIAILAPVGALQSIIAPLGSVYLSKGRSDLFFKWGLGVGFVTMMAFIIGVQWKSIGVAIAYAVSMLVIVYPAFAIPFKLIGQSVMELVFKLSRPLFTTLIMGGAIILIKYFISFMTYGLMLSVSIMIGIALYSIASWYFNREQIIKFYMTMKSSSL